MSHFNEQHLIFIISQPRSGSTYLQNLLSNNSEVNTCSEPWILLNFANQINSELIKGKFNNKEAQLAFNDYLSKYPQLNIDDAIKNLIIDLYRPMADDFTYVIDKTPRYWEIMDEMIELFPKSKFIILKRNPIDVLTSIIKTFNIADIYEINEFRRDLLYAPMSVHATCKKHIQNNQVLSLRYEDLISNPLVETKKLYKWIGIDFDTTVLNTENNIKYKGNFGDPYQNSEVPARVLIKQARSKKIAPDLKKFIIGYRHFLLNNGYGETGEYVIHKGQPTKIFKKFLSINHDIISLNKEIYNLKNSRTYKIGKLVVIPLKFLKNIFKEISFKVNL